MRTLRMRPSLGLAALAILLAAVPAALAQTAPKVGDPAPEMGIERLLQAPAGQKTDLASLRGNVVVLEFWATWCAPCIAAMPHIGGLAKKYEGKPIRFISVSDETPTKVEGFLKRGMLKTWVGIDSDASLLKAYGIRSIPTTIIIDAKGRIAAITHPEKLDEKMLDRILAGERATPPTPSTAAPQPATPAPAEVVAPLYEMTIRATEETNGFLMLNPSGGVIQLEARSVAEILQVALQTSARRVLVEGSLPSGRFNVNARVPKAQATSLYPELRKTVETAWGLEIRKEVRRVPVTVLVAPSGAGAALKTPESAKYKASSAPGTFAAQAAPLSDMHGFLEAKFDRILVDETNLTGKYDYLVAFTEGDRASLRKALAELGIQVLEETREMEVYVVRPRRAGG